MDHKVLREMWPIEYDNFQEKVDIDTLIDLGKLTEEDATLCEMHKIHQRRINYCAKKGFTPETHPFNFRPYDPFHVLARSYNIGEITSIDSDLYKYFLPKDQCLRCTGNHPPNQASCYNSVLCNMRPHSRMSKNTRLELNEIGIAEPCCEMETNMSEVSIELSRSCLVISAGYSYVFDFIFRTSKAFGTHMHHRTSDHYNDNVHRLAVISEKTHSEVTAKTRAYKRKLNKLYNEISNASSIITEDDKVQINSLKEQIRNEANVYHDKLFFQLLLYGYLVRKGIICLTEPLITGFSTEI